MAYEILETCMLVPGLKRSDCASWVQAWGSIAAIGVAIWVSGATERAAAKNAKYATVMFATTLSANLAALADATVGRQMMRLSMVRASLQVCVEIAGTIQVEKLPLATAAQLLTLRSCAAQVLQATVACETAENGPNYGWLAQVLRMHIPTIDKLLADIE